MSSTRTILPNVQQTFFSATSVAAKAHAVAHYLYWKSSRGYFSASETGCAIEWVY